MSNWAITVFYLVGRLKGSSEVTRHETRGGIGPAAENQFVEGIKGVERLQN